MENLILLDDIKLNLDSLNSDQATVHLIKSLKQAIDVNFQISKIEKIESKISSKFISEQDNLIGIITPQHVINQVSFYRQKKNKSNDVDQWEETIRLTLKPKQLLIFSANQTNYKIISTNISNATKKEPYYFEFNIRLGG